MTGPKPIPVWYCHSCHFATDREEDFGPGPHRGALDTCSRCGTVDWCEEFSGWSSLPRGHVPDELVRKASGALSAHAWCESKDDESGALGAWSDLLRIFLYIEEHLPKKGCTS